MNLKLDTVHVDADAETLTLVWRQPIKTKSRAHPEIEAVYLAEEELAAAPLAREEYFARLTAIRGPRPMPTPTPSSSRPTPRWPRRRRS